MQLDWSHIYETFIGALFGSSLAFLVAYVLQRDLIRRQEDFQQRLQKEQQDFQERLQKSEQLLQEKRQQDRDIADELKRMAGGFAAK